MVFTKEQLQVIENLVIAGGKSPYTGLEGIMGAAQAVVLIRQVQAMLEQEAGMNTRPASKEPAEASAQE